MTRAVPARLREWFAAAPDALLAIDVDGNIVLANAEAARLFGSTPARLARRRAETLLTTPWPSAKRAGASSVEATARTRSGRHLPVEIRLCEWPSRRPPLILAALRDISRTPRFHDAMARSRRENHIATISRLALVSPDTRLAVRRMLEAAAAALELPATAILAADWQHRGLKVRVATGLTPAFTASLNAALRDDTLVHDIYRLGSRRVVTLARLPAATAAPLQHDLAAAGFHDAILVPLMGRSHPLGALLALSHAPLVLDRERTRFLQSIANLLAVAVQRARAEEQLAHVQRLDALGQLTGGIAHDFNNLLTIISGNLQLLDADAETTGDAHAVIDAALHAVDRGAALTRRLLAFARRQPLQPCAVVPQPLLEELAHMLRRMLGETVAIDLACAPDLPDVYADPNELDTALVNLALNARDAMPDGGHLAIAARSLALDADNGLGIAAGKYVDFMVSDTGTGMSAAVQAHALDPFFTTKGAGKGSGLGLSMAYGFAEQSGGTLVLESHIGQGTRVELILPVAHAVRATIATATALAPASNRHYRVLVVEDEPEVRALAARFLRAAGYRVRVAADARQALATLKQHNDADLLFTDVVLGGDMDGIQLATAAREAWPHLAVLLTSGHPISAGAAPGEAQRLPLLPKPYRREQLLAAAHSALAGHSRIS